MEEEQVQKNVKELKFEAKQREEFDAKLAKIDAEAERERCAFLLLLDRFMLKRICIYVNS